MQTILILGTNLRKKSISGLKQKSEHHHQIQHVRVGINTNTAQKKKFLIKDFFSKCDRIRRKRRTWSHLLKRSLIEKFIFCAV